MLNLNKWPSYRVRFRNPLITLLACLLFSLAFSGCTAIPGFQPTALPSPVPRPKFTIGLSISDASSPYLLEIKRGAEEAATMLGADLLTRDARGDHFLQNSQIEELIGLKVNALIITPASSLDVAPAIVAANLSAIPVFTLDCRSSGGQVTSHIGSNNVVGGEMAAKFLVEAIGEKGIVVELQGPTDTTIAEDRAEGFSNIIAEYPEINVVAQVAADFNREKAKTVFESILAEQPVINAVFAHNDEMILGALDAAREVEREDEIVFVGFDAIGDAISAMENGQLNATIAQQPAEMGRLGVETAFKYLTGVQIINSIAVDLALITP